MHWFDYHQAGFVAMATYGSGTRVLDVRNACDIRQVGFHFHEDGKNAANHSYWVPEYDEQGRATTYVYTADAGNAFVTGLGQITISGGIDTFKAELPDLPAPSPEC